MVVRIRGGDGRASPDRKEDKWKLKLLWEETGSHICLKFEHYEGEKKATETFHQCVVSNLEGTDHFRIYTFPAGEKRKHFTFFQLTQHNTHTKINLIYKYWYKNLKKILSEVHSMTKRPQLSQVNNRILIKFTILID